MWQHEIQTDQDLAPSLGMLGPIIEYWLDLSLATGGLPIITDFDLSVVAGFAPEARLIEAQPIAGHTAGRFRYREVGGGVVEIPGRDVTEEGLRLGWADCEAGARALAKGAPVALTHSASDGNGALDVLILPFLRSHNRRSEFVLLFVIFPSAVPEALDQVRTVSTKDGFARNF